ncbi:MAG: hypothetical protein ACI8W7_004448 [Gammaproteobacteria bacterium]|jgi:hypothetical protein
MKPPKFTVALSLCMLMSGSVAADTFVMRDGRSLVGEFLGATARSAHLRTAKGVERIPTDTIEMIRLERRARTTKRDVSSRSNSAVPRALIVGRGRAQSIELPGGS